MSFRGLFENLQFVKALIFVGILTALFLASNIFVIGGSEFFKISNTLISPAFALAACFLFFQASTNKKDTISRSLWINMGLGFGLWGAADVIWALLFNYYD